MRVNTLPLNSYVRFYTVYYDKLHAQGAAGARPACSSSYALCSVGAFALFASGLRGACRFWHQVPNPALHRTAMRPLNSYVRLLLFMPI